MTTVSTARRLLAALVALLSLTVAVAACGSGDDDTSAGGSEGGESAEGTGAAAGDGNGFPVEIDHKYGTTTIDEAPQRIVTVGLTDQDTAIALGTVPVGITQWFDTHERGVGAWAEDELGDATPEVLNFDDGVSAEPIAALQPDLILGVYSALTEQEYDVLSQIAPTVAQPEEYVDYGVPWQEQTVIIGRALGQQDEAEALVADVEARFAAVRADHPEFEGATGVVASPYQGTVSVYSPEDPRGRFLTDLGFVLPSDLEALAGDHFAAELSTENVDLLDVDALVWILNDVDADLARLHGEPVYGSLAVVSEGREVGVSNFETLGEATSFQTVLSLPLLLDGIVPMLAAAVDGDPITQVLQAGG
jgi:iron complex transport system substrate-binding protein